MSEVAGILWLCVLLGTGPATVALALALRKYLDAGPILAVGMGLSVIPMAVFVWFLLSYTDGFGGRRSDVRPGVTASHPQPDRKTGPQP